MNLKVMLMSASKISKKDVILAIAAELRVTRYTPAEIEQIRRQLAARLGAPGKTSVDYVTDVLEDAGLRVARSTQSDTDGRHEEEFRDLLRFATLEEAEMCLVRLDEMLRKFRAEHDRAAAERVLEVGRLGRRRAEMIARNRKVDRQKRADKEEILQWFRIWLETPETFFDWLEIRKQSPDFVARFGSPASREDA